MALMKRRSLRNTICLSTLDLNDVGIPKEVEPVFVQPFCRHEQQQQQQHRRHQQQQPHLKEDSAMRQSASHTNKARSLADSYGDDKCSSSHKNDNKSAIQQWRKAKRAADEDHLWPRPLPRTSLLRQENAPPAPPRRMSLGDHLTTKPFEVEGRICTDEGIGGGGRSLRLREQPAARSTTSIEKNLPSATVSNAMKRKLRRVDGRVADGIADDEESFVEWSSTAGSATGEGRKRRKTVRFQDSNNNNNINSSSISSNNLALLRNSDQSSGRAKLQLCLYLNYGHVSVHVMRGANLPLLPDQHELNSYVKVNFEPSDLRSQHRSQVVSGTVDPSYDFRLSFEIPPEAACERSVLVTVWHRDYITKQSRLLGFLNFSLTKIMEAKRIEGWFRLPSLAVTKKTHI